jgi:hypothetical protein
MKNCWRLFRSNSNWVITAFTLMMHNVKLRRSGKLLVLK